MMERLDVRIDYLGRPVAAASWAVCAGMPDAAERVALILQSLDGEMRLISRRSRQRIATAASKVLKARDGIPCDTDETETAHVEISIDRRTVMFGLWREWDFCEFSDDVYLRSRYATEINVGFDPTEEMSWLRFMTRFLPIVRDRDRLESGYFMSSDGCRIITANA